MQGCQCVNQESPGKTETRWSHLLASGGRKREGNLGEEKVCWSAGLRCAGFSQLTATWASTPQWRAEWWEAERSVCDCCGPLRQKEHPGPG